MSFERLRLGDYVVRERRASQIDPAATIVVETGMVCPRCRERLPVIRVIRHGEAAQCGACGLHMRVFGNALFCCTDGPISESAAKEAL